jgi:hypothetical protein
MAPSETGSFGDEDGDLSEAEEGGESGKLCGGHERMQYVALVEQTGISTLLTLPTLPLVERLHPTIVTPT